MDEEKLKMIKEKIRDEELIEIYKKVLGIFLLCIICAVIAYFYCKENQYKPIRGIIMGIACPWGYVVVDKVSKLLYDKLEDLYKLVCIVTISIYAIIWFIIKLYISMYVGLIAGPIMAIYYVIQIRKIWKKDYSEEAKSRYYSECTQKNIKKHENQIRKLATISNDNLAKHEDEKYYCEMCFRRISQEEYEMYECMCEECFMDIHTDENGKFDENYYKY